VAALANQYAWLIGAFHLNAPLWLLIEKITECGV